MKSRQTIADIVILILNKYNKASITFGEFDIIMEIYETCVKKNIMKKGRKDISEIQHAIFNGLEWSTKCKKVLGINNKRIFKRI